MEDKTSAALTQNQSQTETKKKPYVAPQLTRFGDVAELTRGGRTVSPGDAQSSFDTEVHPAK